MFQFDDKWDVDTTAESLNASLFGKSKKRKALTSASANNGSQFNSSVVADSDDEQFSKNDKKRLKKWRKKNRADGKTIENDSTRIQQNNQSVNSILTLSKKNIKTSKNSGKLAEQKLKMSTSFIKSGTTIVSLKKKKLQIIEKDNSLSSERLGEKKGRKRKLSLSDNADKTTNSNKSKKAKVDENKNNAVSTNDVTTSGDEKKKRKRNRKKKNNSKKNKYKHLSLNSTARTGDLDSSQGNESIDKSTKKEFVSEKNSHQTLEPSLNKLYNHKGCTQNNKDIFSQKADKLKQVTNRVNNSSADVHSLSENEIQKEKTSLKHLSHNISNNAQPPMRKIKKNKDHSNYEKLGNSSQSQHLREAAELEKLSAATSKVSLKNKRKQQKMLQVHKQDKACENKTVELALTKKKRNMPAVNPVQNSSDIDSIDLPQNDQLAQKNKLKINEREGLQQENIITPAANTVSPVSQSIWGKAAELGKRAKEVLNSARFRYINEQLYSCRGNEALQLFMEDKDAFSVYHDGFQSQSSKWPINPLDVFIKQLRDKPKNLIIADFGCGEARLAHKILQKVHSFDLVALNDKVTACDMSKTPLAGEQVDIAVFCLSLMGTNISDYIHEASRVLKTGGLLKVAEVVSRFSGLSRFTDAVCSYGFQLLNKRDLDKMFYLLDFKKIKFVKKTSSLPEIKLRPCIYKRR